MKAIAPLALAVAVMAGAFAAATAFGTVAAEVASFIKSVNLSAAASVNSDHR